ncbi:YhcH/YjgK/YiaL family protein [Enterococcus sp. LJL98]
MIYDTMTNLGCYKGIHPNLDRGIDFLLQTPIDQLPLGVTKIDGEKVFINIMHASLTQDYSDTYEFHEKYLDLQFNLMGEEQIGMGLSLESQTRVYDETHDFGTIKCKSALLFPLGDEHFIICMAKEPHQPGIQGAFGPQVKKGVVKILVE